MPESWRVLWRDGGQWKPVQEATGFPVAKDRFNSALFAPVTTDAVRLDVQLKKEFSGGILEWRLKPACRRPRRNKRLRRDWRWGSLRGMILV